MNIYINNTPQQLSDSATLSEALSYLTSQRGVAVAINDEVIPRTLWEEHLLKSDDKITVIKATQGG